MSPAAAASFFVLLLNPTSPAPLPLDTPQKGLSFPLFRAAAEAPGYRLTGALMFSLEGGRKVVRLTYTNDVSRNQFDLIQSPAKGKTSDAHMRSVMQKREAGVDLQGDHTFVTLRKGSTDVAFVGTLISSPSARKILQGLEKYKPL